MRNHLLAVLGLVALLAGTAGAIALQAYGHDLINLPADMGRLLLISPVVVVVGGLLWFWSQRLLDNLRDPVAYGLAAPGLLAMLGLVTLSVAPDFPGLAIVVGIWIPGFLLAVYAVMALIVGALASRRLFRYYRSLRK